MQVEITDPNKLPQNIKSIEDEYIVKLVLSKQNNGQGKVFLVVKDTEWYAAKLYTKSQDLQRQAHFMKRIGECKHIIKYIYHNKNAKIILQQQNQSKKLYQLRIPTLIMQYSQHGDLLQFINHGIKLYSKVYKLPFVTPYPICKNLFYQIIEGLKYIHSKQIFHRDIKLQNLILDKDFNVKIVDFGLAGNMSQRDLNGCSLGTPGYRAPQVQFGKIFDEKSDLFACGYAFYILCFKCFPFLITSENNEYKPFARPGLNGFRLNQNWESLSSKRNKVPIPQQIKTFFSKIFLKKFDQRPSIQEIQASNLFQDKATQADTQKYMSQQYQKYVNQNENFRKKVTQIRQIKQQLHRLRQQKQNPTQNTRHIQIQNTTKQYQQLNNYYQMKGINKQKLQNSSNIHQINATSAQPSELLAWLELSLNQIYNVKRNQVLFTVLSDYVLKKYQFQVKLKSHKILIYFLLQSEQQNIQEEENNQQNQSEQNSQQNTSKMELLIEGTLLRRKYDNKILIKWHKKQGNNIILSLILSQIQQLMFAFVTSEQNTNIN